MSIHRTCKNYLTPPFQSGSSFNEKIKQGTKRDFIKFFSYFTVVLPLAAGVYLLGRKVVKLASSTPLQEGPAKKVDEQRGKHLSKEERVPCSRTINLVKVQKIITRDKELFERDAAKFYEKISHSNPLIDALRSYKPGKSLEQIELF